MCPGNAAPTALWTALLAGVMACRPPAPPPADQPGTTTDAATSTGAVGTTFFAPDACEGSSDCETDAHCVAPYDPGSDPPQGPGACVEACIEANNLVLWCLDDAGCCGDLVCSEVDGLCEPRPGADSGSSSGSGSGSSDSSGSSSDSTSGTDSDSGSSSSSGSTTG